MTVIYDSVLHKFRTRDQAERLVGALVYKGELLSVTSLGLLTNKQLGDWYSISGGPEAGADYYYNGTDWKRVGGESGEGYVTSEQAEAIASDTAETMIHNGSLTISQGYWEEVEEGGETYWSSGTSVVSFTANAASNVAIDIPAFQSATVTVSQGGSALGSFTSLDPEDVTIELAAPGTTVMYGQNPVSSLVRGANIDMTMGSSGALTIAGSVYPVKYNGANVTEIVQGTNIHMDYDAGALYISGNAPTPAPTYNNNPVASFTAGSNVSMSIVNGGLAISAGVTYDGGVFPELAAGANVTLTSSGSAIVIAATGGGGGGGAGVYVSGTEITSMVEGDNVTFDVTGTTLTISAAGPDGGIDAATASGMISSAIVNSTGRGTIVFSQGVVSKGHINLANAGNSTIVLDPATSVIASGAIITSMVEGNNIHLGVAGGTMTISAQGLVDTATASAIASNVAVPLMPAVGGGILTISQGNTSKGQFSANATTNVSIVLDEVEHLSLAIPKGEDTSQALHVVIERKEQGSWEGVMNTATDYARVRYFSGLEFVAMPQGGIPATFGGNMCDINIGQLLEHGDECRLKWTVAGDTNHELDSDWEGFIWPNAPGTVGHGDAGEQGPQGDPGSAATIGVGSTTTVAPGSAAVVSNVGNSNAAIFDFYIPRGSDGTDGVDGRAATVQVVSTTTVAPGSAAVVSNVGTENAAELAFYIPRGSKGDPGNAATMAVRYTSTLSPGAEAVVSNVGTTSEAILDFYIPRGSDGIDGVDGRAATVSVVSTIGVDPGSAASVINSGTENAAELAFYIPRGSKGDAATIEVGSTTTVAPGSAAVVSNVGNSNAAIFDFYIPGGSKGDPGDPGSAATINVVSTVTVAAGQSASVENTGSLNAAELVFYIPQGATGADGKAATISVQNTVTVDSGSLASVTNVGDSGDARLIFYIPRGNRGYTGPRGSDATVEVNSTYTVSETSAALVSNISDDPSSAVLDFYIPRGAPGTMSYQGMPITGFSAGSGIDLNVVNGLLVITNTGGGGSSGGGTGLVVSPGEIFTVRADEHYTSVTVSSGGSLLVSSMGTAENVTVDLEGNITVKAGGTALQVNAAPMEPVVSVDDGGVIDYVALSGYYYRPNSTAAVSTGTDLSGTTMGSAGALLKIYDGGSATDTVVSQGEVHVYSQGQLIRPTILSSGSCFVYSNGIVSNGNVGTAVHGTWGPELYIKGGTATVTSVNKGGTLYVYGSGSATSVIDSFGVVHIGNGGKVSGISGGGVFSSGGTRAMIHVWKGGECIDAIVSNTHSCVVHARGSAVNIVAGTWNSSAAVGWIDVYAGGVVASATISPNGIIRVYSAAVVNGVDLQTYTSGNFSSVASMVSAAGAIVTNITSGAKAVILPTGQESDPYKEPDWI